MKRLMFQCGHYDRVDGQAVEFHRFDTGCAYRYIPVPGIRVGR